LVLPDIVVTGTSIPQNIKSIGRDVTVISRDDIEKSGKKNIDDVLRYVSGVDVKSRGPYDVQSDISIRGSRANQVLILIDGIKMNDAQTEHYNMDLPINIEDIEKIEVIKGGASSIYGSNAYGGVINILTKPKGNNNFYTDFSGGSFNLNTQALGSNFNIKGFKNSLSFKRSYALGDIDDTDFETYTGYFNTFKNFDTFDLNLSYGRLKKDYGADSFYTEAFPHEEEHIDSHFAKLKVTKYLNNNIIFDTSFWYRWHKDIYFLDRYDKDYYKNKHIKNTYGSDMKGSYELGKLKFLLGLTFSDENIDSNNLGDHSRFNSAPYGEIILTPIERLSLSLSMRADYYKKWGWNNSPAFNATYDLAKNIKLRTSVNKSFRIPDFTELYYDSPTNKGNSSLDKEKAINYEVGTDIKVNKIQLSLTYFMRHEKNAIDWVGEGTIDDPYVTENIAKVDTNGIEFALKKEKLLFIERPAIYYTFINQKGKNISIKSKYLSDYPEDQVIFNFYLNYPWLIRQYVDIKYENRRELKNYCLLSSTLSKNFKIFKKGNLLIYMRGSNLLDSSYSLIKGVKSPGRWLEGGVKFSWNY
jgi:iron complex outermembrane receptor protein